MKTALKGIIGVAACAVAAVTAYAAVIVDDSGVGFVGKGDVQLKFDWNNSQLQHAVTNNLVTFRIKSSVVSVQESTWTCDKDNGPQTQEREIAATTTTTTEGLLSTVARVKNQVSGFNLNGFPVGSTPAGASVTTTEGPALWSCPTGWTAINKEAGTAQVTSSTVGLQISGNGGTTYVDLANTPVL